MLRLESNKVPLLAETSKPSQRSRSPLLASLFVGRRPQSERILLPLPPPPRTSTACSPKYKRLGCFGDKGDDRILGERMYNEEQQSTDVRRVKHHFIDVLGFPLAWKKSDSAVCCVAVMHKQFCWHNRFAFLMFPAFFSERRPVLAGVLASAIQDCLMGHLSTAVFCVRYLGVFVFAPPCCRVSLERFAGCALCSPPAQPVQFCYDYCAAMGAPLMATQWGIECWCATEVVVETDFKRHGEDEVKEEVSCDYPCPGNPVR